MRFLVSFFEDRILTPLGVIIAVLAGVGKFEDGSHYPDSIIHFVLSVLFGTMMFVMLGFAYRAYVPKHPDE